MGVSQWLYKVILKVAGQNVLPKGADKRSFKCLYVLSAKALLLATCEKHGTIVENLHLGRILLGNMTID